MRRRWITVGLWLAMVGAAAGQQAADGTGANSPFATALVNHMTRPGLDLRKAFGYVRDDVLKATSNKQEPFVYGSLGGTTVKSAFWYWV